MEKLKIIDQAMTSLGLNYAFVEWNGDIVYPYFVGDYQEAEPTTEDGYQETAFTLTGFTRNSWLELEEAKEKIERHFNNLDVNTVIAGDGSAVAVFYSGSFVVPTGDAELKKMQINLVIKEWKVK